MKRTISIALILAAMLCQSTALQANTVITYQGRLDAGGAPHSGTVGMDFRLYASPTGGSPLATQLGNTVQVNGGLFQLELDFGDQPYQDGLWLRITVNGQHLTPRQRLSAAPFAVRAGTAQAAHTARILDGDCPGPTGAPDDEMVRVGGVCMDVYEASLWDAPVGGNQITGAIPCNANGQDCDNIYARSVAGVVPRASITWFQAQRALANSGKRLPSNAEWQMAASGTPDHPGPCNTDSGSVQNTGANPGCVSDWGVFDMVGNVWEWVADWVPLSTHCPGWGAFSDDLMCLSGASTNPGGPGALVRGGNVFHSFGTDAGPFAVRGDLRPSDSFSGFGFRGAR